MDAAPQITEAFESLVVNMRHTCCFMRQKRVPCDRICNGVI